MTLPILARFYGAVFNVTPKFLHAPPKSHLFFPCKRQVLKIFQNLLLVITLLLVIISIISAVALFESSRFGDYSFNDYFRVNTIEVILFWSGLMSGLTLSYKKVSKVGSRA